MSIVSLYVCSLGNDEKIFKINQNFVIDAIKHYFMSRLINFNFVDENYNYGAFECTALYAVPMYFMCKASDITKHMMLNMSSCSLGEGTHLKRTGCLLYLLQMYFW